MNNDLKLIKKKYGEDMMHFCRQQFPTILEIPGLLSEILTESFTENKELYQDLVKDKSTAVFIKYIFFLFGKKHIVNIGKNEEGTIKTPKELLNEAGYDLYECHTEKDIQSFKKYYAKGEELCTFKGGRLDECYVFFAVKKNVDSIKRENFKYPYRQDEYGTSVISIQFTRGKANILSIKNRYNDTVYNPDATFSNDLDIIIPGLKSSFENTYNLSINMKTYSFDDMKPQMLLDNYVQGDDNKFYKYYSETDEYYFCSNNNVVIDEQTMIPTKYDKNEFIVFENYILDLKNKKFVLLDGMPKDSFLDSLQDISKISINPEGDLRKIEIFLKDKEIPVIIKIDKNNQLIELENIYLETLDNHFLEYADKLKKLITPNVTEVREWVCCCAFDLEIIDMPRVKIIGKSSFKNARNLIELNMPDLEQIESYAFEEALSLEKINTPNLKIIDDGAFYNVRFLIELNMPSLEQIGEYVFEVAPRLEKINIPRDINIGNGSFSNVRNLIDLYKSNGVEVCIDLRNRQNVGSINEIEEVETFEDMTKLEKTGIKTLIRKK